MNSPKKLTTRPPGPFSWLLSLTMKKKSSKKWKSYAKNSVEEFEVEEPSIKLPLSCWNAAASSCLIFLDEKLQEHNIRYSIKSRGKTGFFSGGAYFKIYYHLSGVAKKFGNITN